MNFPETYAAIIDAAQVEQVVNREKRCRHLHIRGPLSKYREELLLRVPRSSQLLLHNRELFVDVIGRQGIYY